MRNLIGLGIVVLKYHVTRGIYVCLELNHFDAKNKLL